MINVGHHKFHFKEVVMKKKVILTLATAMASLFLLSNAHASIIPGLFNTGVDSNGIILSPGSIEQHYIMSDGYISYITEASSSWIDAPPDSLWISPFDQSTTAPEITYYYRITFDLSGLDPSTAIISGMWSTDNDSTMYINDQYTGNSLGIYGYESLSPFTVSTGFVEGINVLEFRVNNSPSPFLNPTALLVSDISGSANPVPIPSSIVLLLSGFAFIGQRLVRGHYHKSK
jgi:hypothetical protein